MCDAHIVSCIEFIYIKVQNLKIQIAIYYKK